MHDESPEVAPEHRAPRVHALHVAAAVVVLVLGGAGLYAFFERRAEAQAWEQAVADASLGLERCLLGEPLAQGETADARIRAIALVNTASDEGWPGRCRVIAARLYDLSLSGDPRLAPVEETLFRIKTLRELPEVGDLFDRLHALELPPARAGGEPLAPPPSRRAGAGAPPVIARDTGVHMRLPHGVPQSGPVDVLLVGRTRVLCTLRTDAQGGTATCRPLKGELDSADVTLLEHEREGPLLVQRLDAHRGTSEGVFEVLPDGRGRRVDPGVASSAARTAFGRADGEVLWIGQLDGAGYVVRRTRGGDLVADADLPISTAAPLGPTASLGRLIWVESSAHGRRRHRGRPRLRVAPLPIPEPVAEDAVAEDAVAEPSDDPDPAEETSGRPRITLAGAARLDEVPGAAELEVACSSADTFVAVLHQPGQYERWLAFHDPSGWASVARLRVGAPHLRCGLGVAWIARGDAGKLVFATCGSRGCTVREHGLTSLDIGTGPVDAAPLEDGRVILGFAGRRGGLRFRVGAPSAIAAMEDTVVSDDAAHGGFDVSEVLTVSRGDHAILLARDGSGNVRALRVGADGSTAPIVAAAR